VAAALVLGVTVAVEVARRNPEPTLRRSSPTRDRTEVDRREVFELAPLPTAQPDPDRPLGAEDRLLNEEPAEPSLPEPRPLEVMGPLPADEPSITTDLEVGPADQKMLADDEGAEEMVEETLIDSKMESPATLGAVAQAKESVGRRAEAERSSVAAQPAPALRQGAASGKAKDAAPVSARGAPEDAAPPTASVFLGDQLLWSGSAGECPVGRWATLLIVRDETVMKIVDQIHRTGRDKVVVCRLEAFRGATLTGAQDGELMVTIVVE